MLPRAKLKVSWLKKIVTKARRRYEQLADLFFKVNKTKEVEIAKPKYVANKRETEGEVVSRLIAALASYGAMRPGDIFCGDSVYGCDAVRKACKAACVLNVSPLNEGNRNERQRLLIRCRDAGIELMRRILLIKDRHEFTFDDFEKHIDTISEADMLLTFSRSIIEHGTTPIGAIRECDRRSLIGVEIDVITAVLAAVARNIRSARQEGHNGLLKRPFSVVNLGGQASTKGYERVKSLLLSNILAEQLLFLGGMNMN